MTPQLELDFDSVPWPAYELRVCHYCASEGRRCSWCGELPSGACTHGRKWWRCDPCDGHGVLWVSDAFGVAVLPPAGRYS